MRNKMSPKGGSSSGGKNFLISIIKFYRKFLSPPLETLFGHACRFTPSCSEYTIEALEKFGAAKGLTLAISRLTKCHPWGKSGYDPVADI